MESMDVLPDHLRPDLRIVFCGTAAGKASALRGAYYAGPGNLFWRTLHQAGFTRQLLQPHEFRLLNDFDIGLTDVAKKASGADAILTESDFCVDGFRRRMDRTTPAFIAFNGKKAASVILGKSTRQISYGLQTETLGISKLFVLPSTSGSGRRYWNEAYWFELARLAQRY